MSGLKNTAKRLANASMGKGYKTNREIRKERQMKRQQALDKIYEGAEMPDEKSLRRRARRQAAGQRGSRVSNVLTDQEDTLG
jgi:hypothetical protein